MSGFASVEGLDARSMSARGYGMARHGSDRNLFVQFSSEIREDKVASREKGSPVHKDVIYIAIQAPGQSDRIERRARIKERGDRQIAPNVPHDDVRFPHEWANFKAGMSEEIVGFRIEEWAVITRATAENLKTNNVFTVEQLSALPDGALQSFPPGTRVLREKAKAFLESAEKNAEVHKLAEINDRLQTKVDSQSEIIAELAAKVEALSAKTAKPKPKPKPRQRTKKKEPEIDEKDS